MSYVIHLRQPINTHELKSRSISILVILRASESCFLNQWEESRPFRTVPLLPHKDAIEHLLLRNDIIAISINSRHSVNDSLINAVIACNPFKLLADTKLHLPHNIPLYYSSITESVKTALISKEILDYGLNVAQDVFDCHSLGCTIPQPLVLAYSLALCISGDAQCIYLAGFDGYLFNDPRNQESSAIFELFTSIYNLPLISVTPTNYNIPTMSIYGPL